MFKALSVFDYTFSKVISLTFVQDGSSMTAWYSHFSGKEKLFINHKLISCSRNYGYFSRQYFEHYGHQYIIRLENTVLSGAELYCTLSKNGQDVQRKRVKLEQHLPVLNWYCYSLLQLAAISALILTLCLAVGVLAAYFQWSSWLSYSLVLTIIGFGLSQLCLNIYRQQLLKANIEDDTLR
ncbi:hypothetical protein [Arsukibacterium sp.]|uniref:hypothetical protein n=1 Tax=Arsukibacterium sp. TaxID=1977258 RepID=UPI002FD89321